MRVGFGFDVHRLEFGKDLILGGVRIPHETGLSGHSDADVLIHAVIDALLGAAGLGDIGSHFPDSEDRFKDANSREFLKHVTQLLSDSGFSISNLDATIVAEAPRLSPYVSTMKQNLSDELGMDADRVNIKATTNERMGFVGRQEGIAAYAIVSLNEPR